MSDATDKLKGFINPSTMITEGAKEVKEMATPPEMPKPKVAPTPDDDAARAAKERLMKRKYGKAGRAGTMLTEGSKLG